MKQFIILFLGFISLCGYAQERKSLTTEYHYGTLTFQYYEKDGVKIPDGHMEFTNEDYIEKGEMKDGFRNGLWVLQSNQPTPRTRVLSHFKDGLIDGDVTIEKYEYDDKTKKSILRIMPLKFKNGHLFGENKIINHSDTIYCNFDENGDRVGTWKYVSNSDTYYTEYTPDNQRYGTTYKVDVLGRKTECKLYGGNMPFLFFSNYFTRVPDKLGDPMLEVLPTLSENEYGIVKNLGFPNEDKQPSQW